MKITPAVPIKSLGLSREKAGVWMEYNCVKLCVNGVDSCNKES